jgi:hypothetical protein
MASLSLKGEAAFPPPGFANHVKVMDGNAHTGDQYFDKDGNCWQKDLADGMIIYIDKKDDSKYEEMTKEQYDQKFSSEKGKSLRKTKIIENGTGNTLRKNEIKTQTQKGTSLRKAFSSSDQTSGTTMRKVNFQETKDDSSSGTTSIFKHASIVKNSDGGSSYLLKLHKTNDSSLVLAKRQGAGEKTLRMAKRLIE